MIKINDYSIVRSSCGYEVFWKSVPFAVYGPSRLRAAIFSVIYCSSRVDVEL